MNVDPKKKQRAVPELRAERALGEGDIDKLGFRSVARRVAAAIASQAATDGVVAGVDGKWGSGKSSLVYLIQEELLSTQHRSRVTVVNFRPWLVGHRDALLAGLFSELNNAIAKYRRSLGDSTGMSAIQATRALESLRAFASALSDLGPAVEFIGEHSAIAPVKWFGSFLSKVRDWLKGERKSKSLAETKDQHVKALSELNHCFLVTIDDVDRLDPAEIAELMRRLRSTTFFACGTSTSFPSVRYGTGLLDSAGPSLSRFPRMSVGHW